MKIFKNLSLLEKTFLYPRMTFFHMIIYVIYNQQKRALLQASVAI